MDNTAWLLKLKELKLKDAREFLGTSEIRISSILLTQDPEDTPPITPEEVAARVQCIFADQKIIEVDYVKDNKKFYFGPFGLIVGARPQVPLAFEWLLNVTESDQGVRSFGEATEYFMGNSLLVPAAERALGLLSQNPLVPVVFTVAKEVIKQVAKVMQSNKDDQVGLFDITAAAWCDYPHGDAVADDIVDLTDNCSMSFAMFTNPAILTS